jgi:hypothetical protein
VELDDIVRERAASDRKELNGSVMVGGPFLFTSRHGLAKTEDKTKNDVLLLNFI